MVKFRVLWMVMLALLCFSLPVQGAQGDFYVEEIKGYHYLEGETFRWKYKHEFIVQDYVFSSVENISNVDQQVHIQMIDNSQTGTIHNVTQNVYELSFTLKITYNSNGTLQNIDYTWMMFRKTIAVPDPFEQEATQVLTLGDNRRYDLDNTETEFSAALQYYEYHFMNGKFNKIKVNTELNSDVHEDGRIKRSAIHIIKRDASDKIIFDYNHSVKEVDLLYRVLNYIDQPWLWVPVTIAIPFALVYAYIKISSYIKKTGLKIVKSEVNDDESDKSDTSDDKDKENNG